MNTGIYYNKHLIKFQYVLTISTPDNPHISRQLQYCFDIDTTYKKKKKISHLQFNLLGKLCYGKFMSESNSSCIEKYCSNNEAYFEQFFELYTGYKLKMISQSNLIIIMKLQDT